ncbi:MAG TPA: tail fiber domain-containing protein, partial [Pyrinomonadaceae bacterium]
GFDAGSFNTGSENSFVGRFAGHFNTTGSANSFFGSGAGFANTEGSSNTFVGNHAGQTNTTGAINSFFGSGSGFFNTIGSYNSFFGSEAGALNTEGHDNAFFGRTAGYNNVLGSNNSFFGNLAGYNNTGDQNSFFGTFAGFAGTSGHDNASFGYQAGYNNQTGSFNAFFGSGAGLSSQGCCNSFFGESAGTSNATGFNNTAIGAGANFGAPNLTNATAVGASALVNQNNSLVLGSIANINGATSDTNVGIGTTAPQARLDVRGNSVFSGNVGIGTLGPSVKLDVAGNIAMNNSLIQLRGGSDLNHGVVYSGAVDGPEFRGFGGFRWTNGAGGVSERMRLDLNGNLGIGTASPQARLHVNGVIRLDVLGTPLGNSPLCLNASNQIAFCNISSLRYKTNVHSFLDGLSIINKLRPISFDWKDGGLHDVGLAAEEVDRVAPLFAFRNNKGEIEGVKYNQLSAVFINAFKEQQAQILKQQEQLKRQEEKIAREQDQARQERAMLNAQQLQIDALKKLVCRTHRRNAMCK